MAHMPREREAFAEHVAQLLERLGPERRIELVGPCELLVDGRRLDLDNLYRMVSHDPDRGCQIVEHYLDQLFSSEVVQASSLSFSFVKNRVMPRIQPGSIFEHLSREMVAHVPWVNGTSIVFVTDMPHMTVSITTEQMVRWGTNADDLDSLARQNLEHYAPQLELQVVTSKEGGRAVLLTEQDGYDAARLLLGGLFSRLAPQLGGDFYVATPARDMFIAFTPGPEPFVARLHQRIERDYRRLPYPITPDLFYVTRDGVAGTSPDDSFGFDFGDL